ncbi:MAG TPA: CSLREA domain-containing protein, partial [Pyrinomonadaceae bacterium]|nr:CSLREA domain-containing protein [Pyrinomonadaceae bacterium]
MLPSSFIRSRSLFVVTVLALALAALSLKTDRAFMRSLEPAAPVFAGITVNTTVDENNTGANCSLREAIVAANTDAAFGGCTAGSGSDVITFTVNGTITLTSALADLSSSMEINGPGAALLTVSGNSAVRVFNVTVETPGTASFSGLTISNGNAGIQKGGGIANSNSGTVNIDSCIIRGNASLDSAFGGGGGVGNLGAGSLNISNSTLLNNNSPFGGGVYNNTGTVSIIRSTISGNTGSSAGGGVLNLGSGVVSVANSTISGNTSNVGGGLYNNDTGIINATNATITGNSAPGGGGGIRNFGSGPINLRNNIVALNSGFDADVRGAMTSQGHNLIGTSGTSTGFTVGTSNPNGDLVGTDAARLDPRLGALANNGGPTLTHTLLFGSPAIDAGDNCVLTNTCAPALGTSLTTDQRSTGFNRSQDGNGDGTATVDIGALESRQVLLVTNTNDSGAGSFRQAITDANSNAGDDTIAFKIPTVGPGCSFGVCTISLATELPNLSTNVFINGPGANLVTVMRSEAPGTPQFSIFTVLQNANVAINGLTLTNASSPQNGGAIRNEGVLTLIGLIIANNETTVGGASAVFNGGTGTLTMANSSVWENIASGFAAIYNQNGTASIINSTFAGNRNLSSGPGTAIFGESEAITNITSCTISENIGQSVAVFQNSGINGQMNLKNTIVAGNVGGNASGQALSSTNNLIGGTPRLGPLQLNGGPTQTLALLPGSPAFDAGTDLTSLNGAIDGQVTTIIVGDATSIPAGFGLAIQIDNEQMIVTSKTANTLTVTRGANGTTAASHANGAGVNLAFDQRGTGFVRKADGPDANTTQTLD